VIGGTYPIKQLSPVRLSYNPPEDLVFPAGTRPRSFEELQYLKAHYAENSHGEVRVRHIPTGFMMIHCSVLLELQKHVPSYLQEDTGDGTFEKHYDYFPVRLVGDMYESEDWSFCSLVREHLDCGVWLNANVILTHTGIHTFTAGMDRVAGLN